MTLIQRFGGALSLNIHFLMLFNDYRDSQWHLMIATWYGFQCLKFRSGLTGFDEAHGEQAKRDERSTDDLYLQRLDSNKNRKTAHPEH